MRDRARCAIAATHVRLHDIWFFLKIFFVFYDGMHRVFPVIAQTRQYNSITRTYRVKFSLFGETRRHHRVSRIGPRFPEREQSERPIDTRRHRMKMMR